MASGFQGLVDGTCGSANPLMKLTTHFTEDKAKTDIYSISGAKPKHQIHRHEETELVNEFLAHHPTSTVPVNSFNMKHLMRNLHPYRVEDHSLDFNNVWDSVQTKKHADVQISTFQANPPSHSVSAPSVGQTESRWATEYLEEFDKATVQSGMMTQTGTAAKELYDVMNKDSKFSESEFKSFLKSMDSNQGLMSGEANAESWAEEFSEMTDHDVESFFASKNGPREPKENVYTSEFWSNMEEQWKSELASEGFKKIWDEDVAGRVGAESYTFQEDNPLKDTKDCFEEGKLKLAQGDLPSAVLLFEAAAQQNPENPDVWYHLGASQAKNEHDVAAIAALKRCLQLDPKHLDSLTALSASLANESNQMQACVALKDWIMTNPKYSPNEDVQVPLESLSMHFVSSFMQREQFDETLQLYLGAARMNHKSGQVDSDVQGGLGILFNLSGDYDKAADCFRAALTAKSDDFLLWNRLGATLANGNRNEEAISAYHEALRLYPGFVRTRYNLGICCLNLKTYKEAAEHFLSSLNFQAAGRGQDGLGPLKQGQMSDNIWGSLRLAISLMGRKDLYPEVEARNLESLNREFNIHQS